jgi:putative CocE/NonD family hydrolase
MFARMIAAQGYAVVVQSTRGRFGSEGVFEPLQSDVEDGVDCIEWAAAQEWSTGRVGMFGSSYAGMTQWLAAIGTPPHLASRRRWRPGMSPTGGSITRPA